MKRIISLTAVIGMMVLLLLAGCGSPQESKETASKPQEKGAGS